VKYFKKVSKLSRLGMPSVSINHSTSGVYPLFVCTRPVRIAKV